MSRFSEEIIDAILISKQKTIGKTKYLTLYSQKLGLFEAIIKFSPKLQNQFQGKLEHLTKAEFQIFHGRTQKHIKQIQNAKTDHLENMTNQKQIIINLICQIIQRIAPTHQTIIKLSEILEIARKNLPLVNKPEKLLIYTLIQIIKQIGILFDTKNCQICQAKLGEKSYFQSDGLSCTNCQNQEIFIVDQNTRKAIFYGISTDFQTFSQIQIPTKTEQKTINLLRQILEIYSQNNFKLFSEIEHQKYPEVFASK